MKDRKKERKGKKGRMEQKRKCQVEQCALKKFKGVCGGGGGGGGGSKESPGDGSF